MRLSGVDTRKHMSRKERERSATAKAPVTGFSPKTEKALKSLEATLREERQGFRCDPMVSAGECGRAVEGVLRWLAIPMHRLPMTAGQERAIEGMRGKPSFRRADRLCGGVRDRETASLAISRAVLVRTRARARSGMARDVLAAAIGFVEARMADRKP